MFRIGMDLGGMKIPSAFFIFPQLDAGGDNLGS
jgi:hypothetical protein